MDLMTMWTAIGSVGIVCIGVGAIMCGVTSIIQVIQNKKAKNDIVESIEGVADELYILSDKVDNLVNKKKKDKKKEKKKN